MHLRAFHAGILIRVRGCMYVCTSKSHDSIHDLPVQPLKSNYPFRILRGGVAKV
jgi:hypothetical protein